jgi:peptidoglycan/LPS O-acetylase OafA/YrhL
MIATWCAALYRLPLADVSTALWAVPFPLLMGCALAMFVSKARFSLPIQATLPLSLFLFWGYLSFASHQESRSATTGTFSLLAGLLAMGIVACAVSTVGQPRNWLGRLLQECGKLSYSAYLFHPLFAFIAMATATKIGVRWSAPFMGVAMVLPIAFATHRWIEQPILLRRQAVEKSPVWRCLCACLQVAPIVLGLMMFFPWHDLAAKIRLLPNLMWILAGLVAFAIGARAYCLTRKRRQEPMLVGPLPLTGP